MIRNVGIGILFLAFIAIISGLVYMNLFQPIEPSSILYKQYCDDLIVIDNNTDLSVQANVVDNTNLDILLTSSSDTSSVAHINVSFLNQDGKEVVASSNSAFVFANNYGLAIFNLPDLSDNYAGEIQITIIEESVDSDDIDISNIIYETSDSLPLTLSITNNNNYSVFNLVTYLVALRNGDIINVDTFFHDSILSNETVMDESSTFLEYEDDDSIPYDNLLVFPSSANIG